MFIFRYGDIFKKHQSQLTAVLIVLVMSLSLSLSRLFSDNKVKREAPPLSEMVPKGFVFLPVEIGNGEDLIHLIGSHGVVDLYNLSPESGHPEDIVARALKVLLPFPGDSRFVAIMPEKQLSDFFQHRGPFYAVIRNSEKSPSQIYKKKVKGRLKIISEGVGHDNDSYDNDSQDTDDVF